MLSLAIKTVLGIGRSYLAQHGLVHLERYGPGLGEVVPHTEPAPQYVCPRRIECSLQYWVVQVPVVAVDTLAAHSG